MEVLRSSEVLEKEILEDARRKAARILENAEKECKRIREEWDRKLAEESERLARGREEEGALLRARMEASVPLDLMRAKLAFTDEAVRRTLGTFLDNLRPQEIDDILGLLLRRALTALGSAALVVLHAGLEADRAKRLVQANLPEARIQEVKSLEDPGLKGIVLETADGRMRYRATMKELSTLLLEDRRAELASALLGKEGFAVDTANPAG